MHHSNAARIGRDSLVGTAGYMNNQVRLGRLSIRIGTDQKDLVLEIGNELASFGHRGDDQGRLTNGDRFSARFAMLRRILYGGLYEHLGRSMVQWMSRKVYRQLQVEPIAAVMIRFSVC